MNNSFTTVNSFHYPMPPSDPGDPAQVVASSSVLGSEHFDPEAMTPDALLLYLTTRMGSLDGQMDTIFERQKSSEKVRTELRGIQKVLTTLVTDTDKQKPLDLPPEASLEIQAHIDNIAKLDPALGEKLQADLTSGQQILAGDASKYSTSELEASQEYLRILGSDLESGSQMDMITLQSLMGARQTAIQLSTNLISALSESQKSIVSNIR